MRQAAQRAVGQLHVPLVLQPRAWAPPFARDAPRTDPGDDAAREAAPSAPPPAGRRPSSPTRAQAGRRRRRARAGAPPHPALSPRGRGRMRDSLGGSGGAESLRGAATGGEYPARAMASGRWVSSSAGAPMASAPTSATRRFKVAVSWRGAGRERSVSDSCAGASRTGRARNVSASTTPRGGRASSARRSSPPTDPASVMGTAGVSAPSCTRPSPSRQVHSKLSAASPAAAEARADAGGQLAQALHHRLERLEAPLARHRLLEERHRPPRDERARIFPAGQALEPDAVAAEPLEQPRGGQRGQLAERAEPPSRQARGRLLRQVEQRERRRGEIGGVAARLDDQSPRARGARRRARRCGSPRCPRGSPLPPPRRRRGAARPGAARRRRALRARTRRDRPGRRRRPPRGGNARAPPAAARAAPVRSPRVHSW